MKWRSNLEKKPINLQNVAVIDGEQWTWRMESDFIFSETLSEKSKSAQKCSWFQKLEREETYWQQEVENMCNFKKG